MHLFLPAREGLQSTMPIGRIFLDQLDQLVPGVGRPDKPAAAGAPQRRSHVERARTHRPGGH